jgi:glycosyltransferase involved in cell wall biosynthesis
MVKKIYLEPPWKMHAGQHRLVAFPPSAYEFVVAPPPAGRWFEAISRWNIAYRLMRPVDNIIPTMLTKSYLQRWNKPPAGTVLTYACDHLVFRQEPWVVEVEFATMLAGIHPKHLKRFKGTIERKLASSYCKRILCWSEAGRRSLLTNLDSRGFQHKVELVHYSVPPKTFMKEYRSNKVKLLFVGSGTSKDPFEFEGRESGVFEAFALLHQQYSNLELVVRSDVPAKVKAQYGAMENVRIIDKMISREELEREFQSADIFILPSYGTAPFTLLDAMSHELPVVIIDSWANAEYVEDEKTGLVAPKSARLAHYCASTFQPFFVTSQFQEVMRLPDPELVVNLAKRVSLLIENPELRRRLGKTARWEVESGKFSLARMNEKLGRIFDEAIAGEVANL